MDFSPAPAVFHQLRHIAADESEQSTVDDGSPTPHRCVGPPDRTRRSNSTRRAALTNVSTKPDYCANIIFNHKLFHEHEMGFDP
jgi:hypothetical protein